MAEAGPDYERIYADIGANGRCCDEGIWSNSNLEDWKKKTVRKYCRHFWSKNVDE